MFQLGLVSISFRSLTPSQIIAACRETHLSGIEWGGDMHVPHGDLRVAREIEQMTREAGLQVVSYGSYYRCDFDATLPFEKVLESAIALDAPIIRVWAGNTDAAEATPADFGRVVADLERISALAATENIRVVTEYHGGTLTANGQSAHELLATVHNQTVGSLWQPLRRGADFDPQIGANIAELEQVAPFFEYAHVYEWGNDEANQTRRFSLQDSAQWPFYLQKLREIRQNSWLMLEFMPDDNLDLLEGEVAALRELATEE